MVFQLVFFLLWAEPLEPLYGVPPGYTKYEIRGGIQTRPIELIGTLDPPEVVMGGKKLALEIQTPKGSKAPGLYINGKRHFTKGRLGQFYTQLKGDSLKPSGNQVQIVTKDQVWHVILPYSRLFFERSINKNILTATKESQSHWQWKGVLPKNINIYINGKLVPKSSQGEVILQFPLSQGSSQQKVLVDEKGQRRTVVIPFEIKKIDFDKSRFYFALQCKDKKNCGGPLPIKFHGGEIQGLTNPGQILNVNGEKIPLNSEGNFQWTFDPECLNKPLSFKTSGNFGTQILTKPWYSNDCNKFNSKNKSRFYLSFGLGHYGLMDSPAPDVKVMMTENLEPYPRLGFGIRIYEKIYFDARFVSIGKMKSSDSQHNIINVDFNAFSVGYPYRGRWFGALGLATYKPNYWRYNDPNFFGSQSHWAASLFVEGGHRFFLSPSWTLNSRILAAPSFFSQQSDPWRKWPFVFLEPLALEYHFL